MEKEKALEYMNAIHDSLPNSAMKLLARDIIRFIENIPKQHNYQIFLKGEMISGNHKSLEEAIKEAKNISYHEDHFVEIFRHRMDGVLVHIISV